MEVARYFGYVDLWRRLPSKTEIVLASQFFGKLAESNIIASEKRLDRAKIVNVSRGTM